MTVFVEVIKFSISRINTSKAYAASEILIAICELLIAATAKLEEKLIGKPAWKFSG